MFREMRERGLEPNVITFNALLSGLVGWHQGVQARLAIRVCRLPELESNSVLYQHFAPPPPPAPQCEWDNSARCRV